MCDNFATNCQFWYRWLPGEKISSSNSRGGMAGETKSVPVGRYLCWPEFRGAHAC